MITRRLTLLLSSHYDVTSDATILHGSRVSADSAVMFKIAALDRQVFLVSLVASGGRFVQEEVDGSALDVVKVVRRLAGPPTLGKL